MRIAPEDSGFIRSMIAGIRTFSKHDMQPSKPIELWKPWDYYARQFITLPYLAKLARWSKSIEDSLSKCRSGLLKQVLHQDFFTRYPFYFMLISIGEMDRRNVGYPIGGSLSIADMIEKKYLHLGGRIHFDARVKKILVNKNRAEGIVLENGNIEARSDFVVSAADGFSTIFELLEGNYVDKSISSRYNGHAKWPSAILVSLGVSRTFPGEPDLIELRLKKPLVIDERSKADSLPVTIYKFDPTLAPKGKTCLRVILHTDNFSYWQKLRVNHESTYKAEKERIAEQVIETLEKRIGGIKRSLETIDVATPATLFRYTSNWNGSIQGWQWLPGLIPEHMKSFLPKLQRFWMTGQWTMPGGGISGAFISARDLARVICRRNGIRFTGV
jgi:phytoene dehydrogenase-like protein